MGRYSYRARTMDGRIQRGVMEAADGSDLIRKLNTQGLYCCEWREGELGSAKENPPLRSAVAAPLCRQLSSMLRAGVPLPRVLAVCCETAPDRRTGQALKGLMEAIHKGMELSEAMETMAGCFPPLLVCMVRAGESSGRLAGLLERMAVHYEREEELRGKVRAAMLYPILLLLVTIGVTVFLLTTVLPQFALMLEGRPLPWVTVMVLSIGAALEQKGIWYLLTVLLLTVGAAGCLTVPILRRQADRAVLCLPVVGRTVRTVCTARLAAALAALYEGGIGILDALHLAGDAMDNTYMKQKLEEAAEQLREGVPLTLALGQGELFHPVFCALLAAGEEAGSLGELLSEAGEYCRKEAEQQMGQLVALAEPAMILIMALIVGTVVLAVMLPVFSMYTAML